MRQEDARNIVLYYKNIPGMIRVFRQQREDLMLNYDSAKAVVISDMPHGSDGVDTTELFGIAAAEKNVSGRLRQIESCIVMLEQDRDVITSVLDMLNGEYKTLLIYKLVFDYSWTKVSMSLSVAESTLRYRFDLALERLAECLTEYLVETGTDEAIVKRASRAR